MVQANLLEPIEEILSNHLDFPFVNFVILDLIMWKGSDMLRNPSIWYLQYSMLFCNMLH